MNSYNETVFIDIDETTSKTIEDGVYPIINQIYGTDFQYSTTHNCRDVFGDTIREGGKIISLERKIQLFNGAILEDKGKNIIGTVEGSIEKILELSKCYNIGMLTARHSSVAEYTHEWVKSKYNGIIGKVLFSNDYHGGKRRKSDICIEHGVKIMIEDDMDYSLELAKRGIFVFLLRKPWNEQRKETHRNIKKIDKWSDLEL